MTNSAPDHPRGEFVLNGDRCPYCRTHKLRKFNVKAHDVGSKDIDIRIVECKACRFAWQWPTSRSTQESVEYFQQNYSDKKNDSYFESTTRREISQIQLRFVNSLMESPGTILDVGAGDGTFMKVAIDGGWRAVGLDPAAKQTRDIEGGSQLISGTLEDLNSEHRFDIITLWDVIEHVDDPQNLIRECVPLLRPGGYLIIETGNYQSADRISGGADWWAYQADHRWYFSPKILTALMEEIGLTEFTHAKSVFRPWWNGKAGYSGPSKLAHIKSAIRRPGSSLGEWRKYHELRRCAQNWPNWSGLPIITIAGKLAG